MLSRPESIPELAYTIHDWMLRHTELNQPVSVIDVGPGWGKWGVMVKEIYASICAERGQMKPNVYGNLHLQAVECCEYFNSKTQLHLIYDRVHSDDWMSYRDTFARDRLVERNAPCLVLAFDVLEHWSVQEGQLFVDSVTVMPNTSLLISVPVDTHMYEEPYYGDDCPKDQTAYDHETLNVLARNVPHVLKKGAVSWNLLLKP